MKLKENQVMMLPHKFKFVGLGIVLMVILFVILKHNFSFPFVAEYKNEIKSYGLSLFILGLLFIAWAKDKMEDERTKQMKINALAGSFVFGAIYTVFTPVLNTYFGEPILETTGQGLMSLLLGGHVGMLYGQKFDNWYEERKDKK